MIRIKPQSANNILLFTGFVCVLSVVFALFSQHFMDMRPCAWCVLQRFILILIAVICFLASLPGLKNGFKNLLAAIAGLVSIAGVVSAWYQYTVAAEMFSCSQTFADKFISNSGLDVAMPWLFGIYATCMDAKVDLFGIEYAIWALLLFILCFVLMVLSVIIRSKHSS